LTLSYLVDTDWAVHWLHGNERIQKRMEELRTQGLALSAVSLAELAGDRDNEKNGSDRAAWAYTRWWPGGKNGNPG
jgi:hypothetical protein